MEDKKTVVRDEDLEIIEIAEFKRSDNYKQVSRQKEWERERRLRCYRIAALYAIGFLAEVLMGIFVFRQPVALVCVVLVLESVAAVLLREMRAWVQAAEIVIGIAAGVMFGRLALMIMGAVAYLGAVLALYGLFSLDEQL